MSNSKLVYSTDSNLEPDSDVCEQDINITIIQQKIRLHLDRKKGGKINTVIRGLILKNDDLKSYLVDFYTDFSQLKYVFAEIITKTDIKKKDQETSSNQKTPIDAKLKILEDELAIIEQSNLKFKDENEELKSKINDLNNKIVGFQTEILNQREKINQFDIDKGELEFLRLNLEYSHKCRKSFFNVKGFSVGTEDYKKCILNNGRIND